jgi:hypothetical protein
LAGYAGTGAANERPADWVRHNVLEFTRVTLCVSQTERRPYREPPPLIAEPTVGPTVGMRNISLSINTISPMGRLRFATITQPLLLFVE